MPIAYVFQHIFACPYNLSHVEYHYLIIKVEWRAAGVLPIRSSVWLCQLSNMPASIQWEARACCPRPLYVCNSMPQTNKWLGGVAYTARNIQKNSGVGASMVAWAYLPIHVN
jgi:hypothetical protein